MADSQENFAFDASSVYTTTTVGTADDEDTIYQICCVDRTTLTVHLPKKIATAEEVAIATCQQQTIEPLASHLFALRTKDNVWIAPSKLLSPNQTAQLCFRLRFICDIAVLGKETPNALAYMFSQFRHDFVSGDIKGFADDLASAKGLAIIDMLRAMKEENLTAPEVIKSLKINYLPRDIFKSSFKNVAQRMKDKLQRSLSSKHMLKMLEDREIMCRNWSVLLLKQQYVDFLMECVPDYVLEKFSAKLGFNPNLPLDTIRLNVKEQNVPLERFDLTGNQWKNWCQLQDICDISLIPDKIACQINRLSGPPLYIKFTIMAEVECLVALLDGYNRFTRRFHANLCRDLPNPSLLDLKADRCHGPMEREFLFEKLEGKEDGSFTVCQSAEKYDHYRIDFLVQGILRSVAVEFANGLYKLSSAKRTTESFVSLQDLLSYYWSQSFIDGLHLRHCIRPSENDAVGLRLFNPVSPSNVPAASANWDYGPQTGPVCVPPTALTYLPGYSPVYGQHTTLKRALIKPLSSGEKFKAADVAVRTLKCETVSAHDQDDGAVRDKFLNSVQDVAFLANPSMMARIHGILLSPLSLIIEYFPLGNMRSFLQLYRRQVSLRNMLDAAAQVVKTLWWLEDGKHPYGPVRAKSVFVAEYGNAIKVKFGPVGLSETIHWTGLSSTRSADSCAAWSYGTFLWEVFALGAEPLPGISPIETESLYRSGFRLEKPSQCPDEVYEVMTSCWNLDPLKRPKLSEIMRDVNQLLVKHYDSSHPFSPPDSENASVLPQETKSAFLLRVTGNLLRHELLNGSASTATVPYDPWTIDETALKVIERLGEGRYGEVNKVFYTDPLSEDAPRIVAVKQLKQIKSDRSVASIMEEMRSEMEIMKSLQHESIVEIVGVCVDPVPLLIMEFVENGALSSFLRKNQNTVDGGQLMGFAKDVASGMAYLQGKDIVHRDLAARNILVTGDLRVKISDFGLARFLDTGGYYLTQTFKRDVPLAWYAPEVIEFHKYSSKSDCWSFGVLVWEMFSYAAPPYFCDLKVLAERLREGQRLGQPVGCPEEVYAVMTACWRYEAGDRPDFISLFNTFSELCT